MSRKLYVVRARVVARIKRQLADRAKARGEAESVLLREALKDYLEKEKRKKHRGLVEAFLWPWCSTNGPQCGTNLLLTRVAYKFRDVS
jgi:hypothetical protein